MKTRLTKYLKLFGLWHGLRLYVRLKARRPGLVTVRIPQAQHPIYLRRGTSDPKVFNQLFVDGEYAQVQLQFEPATLLDGGGNIGLAAVYFANRYPGLRILTVEPEPDNFALLQRNVAPYATIQAVQAGIWSRTTPLLIRPSELGNWAFTVEEAAQPGPDTVPALSIPDLIRQAGWTRADVVKLDIEGSEKEVFEADTDGWLPQARALIVELHDWMRPGCSEAFSRATQPFTYRRSVCGEYVVCERTD